MIDMCTFIEHIADRLWRLFYPAECVLCGDPGASNQDLCCGCRSELPWNRHACPRCAIPLPAGTALVTMCAACQQQPPPFDRAWSAFGYAGAIRWLHRRLKFSAQLANSRLLATLLTDALAESLKQAQPRPDCILVMPLHPHRLMRRGFNQSLEVIRPAARQLGLELDSRNLQRVRATRPQSDLPAALRQRNVRGAFMCERDLSGMRVALFDDVVTTGETVAEAARALRRAGAREINVWSLARTVDLAR